TYETPIIADSRGARLAEGLRPSDSRTPSRSLAAALVRAPRSTPPIIRAALAPVDRECTLAVAFRVETEPGRLQAIEIDRRAQQRRPPFEASGRFAAGRRRGDFRSKQCADRVGVTRREGKHAPVLSVGKMSLAQIRGVCWQPGRNPSRLNRSRCLRVVQI